MGPDHSHFALPARSAHAQKTMEGYTMRRIALAAVALLGILVAACGGGAAATTAAGGTIKLTLTEFKYSSPTIELRADEKATLELKNAGTLEHDFKIEAA